MEQFTSHLVYFSNRGSVQEGSSKFYTLITFSWCVVLVCIVTGNYYIVCIYSYFMLVCIATGRYWKLASFADVVFLYKYLTTKY